MSETCSIGSCSITCGDDTYGCICVEGTDGSCSCSCVQDVSLLEEKDTNLRITLDTDVCINVKKIYLELIYAPI